MKKPFYAAHTIITALFAGAAGWASAQSELSVFSATGRAVSTTFVTDYQAVGINPANLGWPGRPQKKRVAFGFLETTLGAQSNAIERSDIRQRLLNTDLRFNQAEKLEAARAFTDAGLTLNVDIMLFGLGINAGQAGGFGFQVRDRIQFSTAFGPMTSELAFTGFRSNYFDLLVLATGDTVANYPNMSTDSLALVELGVATDPQMLSKVLAGSHLRASWYREFNFSYGRHVVRNEDLEVHVGIGLKYLQGLGILDVWADGDQAKGFLSVPAGLGIEVMDEEVAGEPPSVGSALFSSNPAGRGFGVDLGLSMIIKERWRLGAAVTNIGSITWRGTTYQAGEGRLVDLATAGLNNYNIFEGIDEFVSNSGFLTWTKGGATTRSLPTLGRLGVSRRFGDRIEVGAEVALPLNQEPGNLESPLIGIGGDIRALPFLRLSSGLSVGGGVSTALRMPVGITFMPAQGTWEAGVASRDLVTFFTQPQPTLSLSFGFLRFRF